MAWVEIMPRYVSLFRRRGWDSAASFLGWTGILVNRHRDRQVEQVTYEPEAQARDGAALACASGFYLKKEYAVSWHDRFRNAWHGFGWCATAVREGAILQALREAGIGCPEVVALGEDGRQAFVLTRDESAMTDLRAILPTLGEAERRRLADALGRELARMHAAGFEHPDLFAKHILAACEGAAFRFCILDWQRGRRRRTVSWRLRCRDLAALDATLHNALAGNRLRLRCLRAYRHASSAVPPLARLARQIRAAAVHLREQRHIREIGQLAVPARDQQLVPVKDGRLLVVRSYFEELGGRLPKWLEKVTEPDAQARDVATALACASGAELLFQTWPNAATAWDIPPLAHTLFRLQRFGVPAPRLLAVGCADRLVFLLAKCAATTPFGEAYAKAPAALQTRMLQQAGAIVRQIHEAGYYLPAGDSWERRLGVVPATGAILLARVEPLLRGNVPWQVLAPRDLNRQRLLLSPTEQLRFLQGYFEDRPSIETRIRFLADSRAAERQAVS